MQEFRKEVEKRTIYKKYEMGYGEMLYTEAIKPYLNYIQALFENFIPKFFIGIAAVLAGALEMGQELFQTPKLWLYGISILVALDFISGTFRAIADPGVRFSFHRWTKTAFKIASYSIALMAVIVGSNMFPAAMGPLQYIVYGLLTANEIYSVLTNVKLTALAEVLWDWMLGRAFGADGFGGLRQAVDKRALEQFKKKQRNKFERYRMEEKVERKTKISRQEQEGE